jgi:hypothetical protein
LGQAFPPPAVPAFDFDLIVNAETGIFPGEEFFDQLLADPFLADQELQDLVAENGFIGGKKAAWLCPPLPLLKGKGLR